MKESLPPKGKAFAYCKKAHPPLPFRPGMDVLSALFFCSIEQQRHAEQPFRLLDAAHAVHFLHHGPMLVRPTLVLSAAGGMGSTRFSKHRPAVPSSCTNRTVTTLCGSAYLSRLEVMLSRMRLTYWLLTESRTSSSPSSSAQAKPRCCSVSTSSVSGSSPWPKPVLLLPAAGEG